MHRTHQPLLTLLALSVLAGCETGRTAQAPDGLPPYKVAQIETLLDTRLPCLGCHTIDGRGGRVGPDLSEVGARLGHAQIDSMVRNPRARIATTVMPAVIMREDWRTLVIRYLAERGGRASPDLLSAGSPLAAPPTRPEPSAAPPATDVDGAALYGKYCAVCHGVAGAGDGPNAERLPAVPTAHADAAYMRERPDDSLFDAVFAGGYIMGRSHTMPSFGGTLSREEIRALVAYMRVLCDCQGPDWSRDGAAGAAR